MNEINLESILNSCHQQQVKKDGIESISTKKFPLAYRETALASMKEAISQALGMAADNAILHGECPHMNKQESAESVYVRADNGPDFIYTVDKQSILKIKDQVK